MTETYRVNYEHGVTNDDELLLNMGYEPELAREFSPLQIFGVSFSIMSLVPSIASVLMYSLYAGGVGMTWGWFIPIFFIFCIGLNLSELASAMPTAGGLYWWTHKFAPKKIAAPMSFLCGYSNTLGLIASLGSIDYGFANQLLACVQMGIEDYEPQDSHRYGVFAGAIITQAIVSLLPSRYLSQIQTFTIVLNMAVIFVIVIALPIGVKNQGRSLNSGGFVFGNTTNGTDWPYGWSFFLSWLAAIWCVSSHDSCIHMAEEASNAPVAVPFGILMSIGLCWVLGFLVMAILAAVINPDFQAVLDTPTGNPLAQIIQDALGNRWAIGLMAIFAIIQWCMGLSSVMSASRQTWAFARDDCLPFSGWTKKVTRSLPINAILFACGFALIIGLLILVNETAASAIFSLAISALQLSWAMPIFFRVLSYDPDAFTPGPFFMGHRLSKISGWISSIYSLFCICALSMFPSVKHPDASEMNYTVVISVFVWGGSLIYYYFWAHKWYDGPKLSVAMPVDAEVLSGIEKKGENGGHLVHLVSKDPDAPDQHGVSNNTSSVDHESVVIRNKATDSDDHSVLSFN